MAKNLLEKCSQSKIRMTAQRQTIIKVIEQADDHPDADQIYLRANAIDSGEVIEFTHPELEALKEKIAADLGYDLVNHRLELYGRKKTSDQ